MWAAACVFDVVERALTVATNFLRFCRARSVNRMAFAVGVSDVSCDAGVGKMLTGSRLFLGWVVALGSKFMGIGRRASL